tara:strand:- start:12831 stop:13208 length:378 start_codon:yes stop_codon:yes gene_type:complete
MIVSGKITDKADGEGLVGTNVFLSNSSGNKGSNPIGTSADINGNYTFDTQGSSLQHITASFVGYTTQTKPLSSNVDFELSESDTMLDEIVITPDDPKRNWKKIVIISTISIGAIIAGILLYKKYK